MSNTRWIRAVVTGGLLGGLLDILFAISFAGANGVAPMKLLQTVASGWLGAAAFDGGTQAAALGLVSHFALSLLWAGVFVALARRMPALVARPVLAAAGFGVVVLLTMRLVVLPLSAFPHPASFKPLGTMLDLLSHVFLFALPIVFAARRAWAAPAIDARARTARTCWRDRLRGSGR